jgi:hypothetical protein
MRTQQHPIGLGATSWRWRGEYTSTHVKVNTAHPSYAPNANPHSQAHTYLEGADSPPSSKPNVTTVHSDFYSNSFKNLTEDDGPSYVRTWATNPSLTLVTSRLTPTLPHTHTIKASHTQHRKAYKMTNQKTRTTHNPYPTTSYTRSINPNTTNRTSPGRFASPLTRKAN